MLGSLARFSYRRHRLVLFLIFLSFIAALLSSFSSVFFAFKTRFIPPSLLTPRIPGPREVSPAGDLALLVLLVRKSGQFPSPFPIPMPTSKTTRKGKGGGVVLCR